MRPWLGFALIVVVSCKHTEPVAAPAVEASPTAIPSAALPMVEAGAGEAGTATAAYRVKPATGTWLTSMAHEKGYRSFALGATGTVHLAWVLGPSHRKKALPPDQDYPANYVSDVQLRLDGGGAVETVDFGDEPGSLVPPFVTSCKRRGYLLSGDTRWAFPEKLDGLVSAFALGIAQGDDHHLVVRTANALYVLHRETSDGRCDDAKQGPLEICLGFEWKVRAMATITADVDFDETVTGPDAHSVDCAAPSDYGMLRPPK